MKLVILIFIFTTTLLVLFCDKSSAPDPNNGLKTAFLRITNEITNWSEEDSSYFEFDTPEKGYELIDGYWAPYENNGIIEGFRQNMITTGDRKIEIFTMNFGQISNATSIFEEMAAEGIYDTLTFNNFTSDIAIGNIFINGARVFAHFDKYYFELSFMEYGVDTSDIRPDAEKYLAQYKTKTEK